MSWLCWCTSASATSGSFEDLELETPRADKYASASGDLSTDVDTDCTFSSGRSDASASSSKLDLLDHSEDALEGGRLHDEEKFQLVRRLALRWLGKVRAKRTLATLRRSTRTPSLIADCALLPDLSAPNAEKPLITVQLSEVTVSAIFKAFRSEDSRQQPCSCFLRDEMHCTDLQSTPWMSSSDAPGALVQRTRFEMPMENQNIPDVIGKIVSMPKTLAGTSVTRLHFDGRALTVVLQNRAEGVLYSDRFFARMTHRFSEDRSGGVIWHQWLDIVWTKPLPWTHGFLRKIVEKSAEVEFKNNAHLFKATVLECST